MPDFRKLNEELKKALELSEEEFMGRLKGMQETERQKESREALQEIMETYQKDYMARESAVREQSANSIEFATTMVETVKDLIEEYTERVKNEIAKLNSDLRDWEANYKAIELLTQVIDMLTSMRAKKALKDLLF